MVGKRFGFVTNERVYKKQIVFTHCMIYREALAAKQMSTELDIVLQSVVKIINYVKNNALNSRLFSNLCKVQSSDYTNILMQCAIRWLSRGYSTVFKGCCI